jgi:osmotically-inducible protein OsmY
VLRLRGRLSTYYQKQLAQEAVKNLEGVAQILNDIEVVE